MGSGGFDGYRGIRVRPSGWIELVHENWIDERRFSTTSYERLQHVYQTTVMVTTLDYRANGSRVLSLGYMPYDPSSDPAIQKGLTGSSTRPEIEREIEGVVQREEAHVASDPDEVMNYGFYFIREVFDRLVAELGLHAEPHEKIYVKAPVVPVRRFCSINCGDEVKDPILSLVCESASKLAPAGAVRTLRFDILDDGRRRTLSASFESGELRIVALGDGRFVARGEAALTAADAVLLFDHFYEDGARAPTYAWEPM